MTKIITRYFETTEQALKARSELVERQQVSPRIVRLFDTPAGLADTLVAAHVNADTAQAYQARMADGGAVLMVMAGYKPLGVAKTTRKVTADMGALIVGPVVEEVTIKDRPNRASVLRGQPLMLSREKDPYSTNHHMANWPIPLISRRAPPRRSSAPQMGTLTRAFFPLTVRTKPFTASVFGRHARMANFPLPLISKRKPFTGSVFGRHARMANFPLPLISKRKPYTGSLIGKHPHMANWPFPHLINGKQGTNALMPGGPRMANFPISLLSDRKPSTASIIPRHARMANFPISLISKRKPFTGSIIPRHARMADFILPLIIRRSSEEPMYGSQKYSFSKFLGMPTLLRR